MSDFRASLYIGKVVHKRLRPVLHTLSYDVASLLVDVDDLARRKLPRLLSYNRFNLFSLHDKDHGPRGENQPIAEFARQKVREAGLGESVRRILMLSYPRMLGYAFNPLTTFYGIDENENVRLIIYEVHNTFGGRHCYVAGPFKPGETSYATVEKVFRVSPFNGVDGQYGLRASAPGETIAVGVALSTADGPLLKAYFSGKREPLTDANLLRVFFTLPLMTLKVVAGIHWEALKLWLKGLKLNHPTA